MGIRRAEIFIIGFLNHGLQPRTGLQGGKRIPCFFSKFTRFHRRTHKILYRKTASVRSGGRSIRLSLSISSGGNTGKTDRSKPEIIRKIIMRRAGFIDFTTIRVLGTQQKITAPFHLIRGRNAQFLFIRRIFPEDLFLTGSLIQNQTVCSTKSCNASRTSKLKLFPSASATTASRS